MAALVVAGEAVFSLPFHITRFFRPTVLAVFDLTNTELGVAQAVYGVVAMLAYFPGGPLADRFPARRLITTSLLLTSLGGLYFASFPPDRGLWLLFGFWGLTTIFLFWAALIRATREWGEEDEQGIAFGILDGGRGLFAALLAGAAVLLFERMLPLDSDLATELERARALRAVIYLYSGVTAAAGILAWSFIGEPATQMRASTSLWRHLESVVRLPRVWLQALIVVCAYVGYKGVDNYSLYAVQVYELSEVDGARVSTISAWVRPFAAVGAGWLADRVSASLVTGLCFALLTGSYAWMALDIPTPSMLWVLYLNVLLTCLAIFGLRGVYFALFEEASVPLVATGTAVGLVSVVGYTPDIFVHLFGGWLLDRTPGVVGHRHFFFFLTASALVGLLATAAFRGVDSELRSRKS